MTKKSVNEKRDHQTLCEILRHALMEKECEIEHLEDTNTKLKMQVEKLTKDIEELTKDIEEQRKDKDKAHLELRKFLNIKRYEEYFNELLQIQELEKKMLNS